MSKNIKKECEELWAKNKYYVLSKSHKAYLDIREYLKEKEVDIAYLQGKIQSVKDIEESKTEKQGLFEIIEEYMKGENSQEAVIQYLNALLRKYPNKYLQGSTLLTGENK